MRAICVWRSVAFWAAATGLVALGSMAPAAEDADRDDGALTAGIEVDAAFDVEAAEEPVCKDGVCPPGADCEKPADAAAVAAEANGVVSPTHKQTLIIQVNQGDLPKTTLNSFCLRPDGNILAACGEGPGEIRVFNPQGEHVESWELAVRPDAINVGSDGQVYVAGGGKVLRLDGEGNVLLEADAPHAADLLANADKIREQVAQQAEQMAKQFSTQKDRYAKMIEQLEKSQAEKVAAGKELTAADKKRMEVFVQMKEQQEQMAEQLGAKELTAEELDEKVKSSMEYKLRVASISETDGEVFIACYGAVGYGFNVWRLDENFENGEVIVRGLSGCCGQMDVQACSTGVYVAENGKHRVACYDHDGKQTAAWGKGARTGLDGFGSCCNPMNVAFGADGSIYTAESEIGRIKRFSPEGELLDLVGKVDIVPGCKKVAISIDSTGDNVYMLDISRHHIVKMERLAPGETVAYSETRSEAAADADSEEADASSPLGRIMLRMLGN